MSDDGSGWKRQSGMTCAMQKLRPAEARVLRIAAVQDGRVVEERTLTFGANVSVGRSETNHFVVEGEGVPESLLLLRTLGGRYVLGFTHGMRGRIASTSGVRDLDALRTRGAARDAGDGVFELPLDEDVRGRVTLGHTDFLFQFVAAPAVRSRPRLPTAASGGLMSRIDWPFAAFGTFSFMLMFGFLVFLDNADWPIDRDIALVPEAYVDVVFYEQRPPQPPPDNAEDGPEDTRSPTPDPSEPVAPRASETRRAPRRDASEPPRLSQAERRVRLADEARAAAESLVAGVLGPGADGAVLDVLTGGAIPGDAAQVLADAAGVKRAEATAGGVLPTRPGSLDGSGARDLGALVASGGSEVTRERDEERTVEERTVGRATVGAGSEIGGAGEFDGALVVAMIKRRLGAIRACYERELRNDPTLGGKLTLEFTVVRTGTLSGVEAVGNTTGNDALARCIARAISGIRFREGPKGGDVTFAYPFVFAPQR